MNGKRPFWLVLGLVFWLLAPCALWGASLQDYLDEGQRHYAQGDFQGAIEPWERGTSRAGETGPGGAAA